MLKALLILSFLATSGCSVIQSMNDRALPSNVAKAKLYEHCPYPYQPNGAVATREDFNTWSACQDQYPDLIHAMAANNHEPIGGTDYLNDLYSQWNYNDVISYTPYGRY